MYMWSFNLTLVVRALDQLRKKGEVNPNYCVVVSSNYH